jgi:hypothetical protein
LIEGPSLRAMVFIKEYRDLVCDTGLGKCIYSAYATPLPNLTPIFGEEHPDTISTMNNLTSTLGDLGQLGEAARMIKEVLEVREDMARKHLQHPCVD